jgi:hypothetical protein
VISSPEGMSWVAWRVDSSSVVFHVAWALGRHAWLRRESCSQSAGAYEM